VAGYEQSVSNLSQVSLGRDGVFSDDVAGQMPTVAGTAGSGYTIALTIGIWRRSIRDDAALRADVGSAVVARRPRGARACLVDRDGAATHVGAAELVDRLAGVVVGHFDEAEAT